MKAQAVKAGQVAEGDGQVFAGTTPSAVSLSAYRVDDLVQYPNSLPVEKCSEQACDLMRDLLSNLGSR